MAKKEWLRICIDNKATHDRVRSDHQQTPQSWSRMTTDGFSWRLKHGEHGFKSELTTADDYADSFESVHVRVR